MTPPERGLVPLVTALLGVVVSGCGGTAPDPVVAFLVEQREPFALSTQRQAQPSWLLSCEDDEHALKLDLVAELVSTGDDTWSIDFTENRSGFPEARQPTADVSREDVAHCLVILAADSWLERSADVSVDGANNLAFEPDGALHFEWERAFVRGW